jgi:hypothetical protein
MPPAGAEPDDAEEKQRLVAAEPSDLGDPNNSNTYSPSESSAHPIRGFAAAAADVEAARLAGRRQRRRRAEVWHMARLNIAIAMLNAGYWPAGRGLESRESRALAACLTEWCRVARLYTVSLSGYSELRRINSTM